MVKMDVTSHLSKTIGYGNLHVMADGSYDPDGHGRGMGDQRVDTGTGVWDGRD